MFYHQLFNLTSEPKIKISILGANGGFGYSLLAQCVLIPKINVSVVCDIDTRKTQHILHELGWKEDSYAVCNSIDEIVEAVAENKTAITDKPELLPLAPVDMLIESTGKPELSAKIAEQALIHKQHVGMVSKETESVVGPYLAKIARDNNVTYTTVDGDQPSDLIHLYTWIASLGLEIIAAGKSSEYDYVWSPEKNKLTYLDKEIEVKEFDKIWALSETFTTLSERKQALCSLPQYATPDYCEMNVVANSLELQVDRPEMHYPICRINELADIFIPKEDGGILDKLGVVDVFNCLRKDDELSFAGGEFVIVKCHNSEVWKVLKEKGHVVSRNNKYAAIILPYHLMGVESPISIFSAVLHNRASGNPNQKQAMIMAGKAERDFEIGEVLHMGGHHHVIDSVRPLLLNTPLENKRISPFYLMANKKLVRNVKKGEFFTLDDFDFTRSDLYVMYNHFLSKM